MLTLAAVRDKTVCVRLPGLQTSRAAHGGTEEVSQPELTLVAHLYPRIETHLIKLLRSVSPEDWLRPTLCPGWSVKDIAAHLLDTNLRRLSMCRDGFFGETPENADSYDGLVRFLDRLNADWVRAARRISPRALTDWMEITSVEVGNFFAALDPFAKAPFPVAWAGESESLNWFDIAREYTERWHHQQQIRLAVAQPGTPATTEIMTRELYHPVLDTFLRALPRTYAQTDAPEAAAVKITVSGEAGGVWFLLRHTGAWRLTKTAPAAPATTEVTIPQNLAWRLFTNSFPAEARASVQTHGDARLAAPLFQAVAVMAMPKNPPQSER
ncbi:MAG: maleylpyruvate isomerase N-terminal domain-containing protein [Acidobacteriia bacterium]|nr:maleylpyruvate isomerase N-terminal domain-containing protein [Terriglobia bacterium]